MRFKPAPQRATLPTRHAQVFGEGLIVQASGLLKAARLLEDRSIFINPRGIRKLITVRIDLKDHTKRVFHVNHPKGLLTRIVGPDGHALLAAFRISGTVIPMWEKRRG